MKMVLAAFLGINMTIWMIVFVMYQQVP